MKTRKRTLVKSIGLIVLITMLFSSICISALAENAESVNIAEGRQIWEEYLNVFSPLAEDESSYEGLMRYALRDEAAELYSEVTGNPKSEYEKMSSFYKFLWTYTYINPAYYASSISHIDRSTWFNSPIGNSQKVIQANGGTQEMLNANNKLLEWSYNYFEATGEVYNFLATYESDISDVTEPQDESILVSEDPIVSEVENDDSFVSDISQDISQNIQENSSNEQDNGIWDDVIAYFKEHIFSMVLILLLAAATVAVVIYRKNKAIDDK